MNKNKGLSKYQMNLAKEVQKGILNANSTSGGDPLPPLSEKTPEEIKKSAKRYYERFMKR